MKLLLVGNHTCGNRGDAAILRGLLNCIREIDSEIEIDIISRYSISSSYLLGESIKQDTLYSDAKKTKGGIYAKVKSKIKSIFLPWVLVAHCREKGILRYISLPKHITSFTESIKEYDAIIQVGGSFFVDLYGAAQFEHIFCSLLAKKPIYLIGHSVGPFDKKNIQKVAKFAFSNVNNLILRESISKELIADYKFDMDNVSDGVDTAFLVEGTNYSSFNDYICQHWLTKIRNSKCVAMTVRKLAPFDKRLGVTQEQYEFAIARVIEHVISLGYQVIIFSTCTGIESYNNDDRVVALSVKDKVKNTEKISVVMDEINDAQLGFLLSKCEFTIGTRLHSAIISMNFGTPAIAINYEHKSKGIMQSLSMDILSVSVQGLFTDEVVNKINHLDNNYDGINHDLSLQLKRVKKEGRDIISEVIKEIGAK